MSRGAPIGRPLRELDRHDERLIACGLDPHDLADEEARAAQARADRLAEYAPAVPAGWWPA